MLKSIAKETLVESRLKLGKLKLSIVDGNLKNIEKTINYLKRNVSDDELTDENLLTSFYEVMQFPTHESLSEVRDFSGVNLGLGKNLDYSQFREIEVMGSDVKTMLYFDMAGKLAKSKNGGAYKWRVESKGKFTVYDGKKLIASHKLLVELVSRLEESFTDEEVDVFREYFKSNIFKSRKWGYSGAYNQMIMNTIYDIFQDDISIQSMRDYENAQNGEYAKAFMTKKNINKEVLVKMESSQFIGNGFNFAEFDNDTDLSKLEQVEKEWLDIYPLLPKVSHSNTELRFRKLGKHKANGIYFPTQHCLAVDIRSVSSMIHEYGHLIDYEYTGVPISLTPAFRDIIRDYSSQVDKLEKDSYVFKKKYYYTTPTEVFARGFELYMKDKIKTSFLKSEDEYRDNEEYKCFTDENRKRLELIFNELFN